MIQLAASLVLWVAVALTPNGPEVSPAFDSKEECQEIVAAVRNRTGWPVSDCQPFTFKQST